MIVYGYGALEAGRGEISGAELRAPLNLMDAFEALALDWGWEVASTDFRAAQRQLVAALKAAGADADLVQSVRDLRACDVDAAALRMAGEAPDGR